MRKARRTTVSITVAVLMGAALAPLERGRAEQTQDPPFGDEEAVSYAQELWRQMRFAQLVGPEALKTVPYEGQHPHGAVLETFYDRLYVREHQGEVIVKRNYAGENLKNSDVAQDRDAYLDAVTVMYRREEGYDPEHNNWFWAKYAPDGSLMENPKGMPLAGRVAKGSGQGCIACHGAQRADDYQFNTTSFID